MVTDEELQNLEERAFIATQTNAHLQMQPNDVVALIHGVREAREVAEQLAGDRALLLAQLEPIQEAMTAFTERIQALEKLLSRRGT